MKTNTLYPLATASLLILLTSTAFAQSPGDEIIVTGSPLNRSIDEAITGVSVLSGDELLDRLAGTIGETLKYEPGVSSTFFGAGASRPIIRGQGGDRVRVLTNGIGSIDASSASPDHAVAAEPAQAERIEVLRGATLLRFGSSGAGGVVNIIDGRIPDQLPKGGIDGALRVGVSSVDTGREIAGSIDTQIGSHLVLHLDGTLKQTEDYQIPGFASSEFLRALDPDADEGFGELENSATKTSSLTSGLSYIGTRGFLGAAVHHFASDYDVPGGHDGEQISIGLDQVRFDLNGALELDGFFEKIEIFGGIADYEHTEFEGPGVVGTVFTNQGYEVRAEAVQAERNGWAAAYGVQVRSRDFAAIGDEAFVPPTNTQQIGIYMFHEKQLGALHVEGAARFETTNQEVINSGQSRQFHAISVSAGADFHVNDAVRLGGTLFRTERAPTTEELFSNGPHLATNQFERGDALLGLETAIGIEAALRYRQDGHFFTANAFYTEYSNYIFERETGEIEDGLPVFAFGAEDVIFQGFELLGGMDLWHMGAFEVKVDALVEYVQATTSNGSLPRIPPFSVLTGVEASSERITLRAELDYAVSQSATSAFDTPTDGYGLVNLFATWRPVVDTQVVRFSLSVLNLFDAEARQHASFLKDIAPLPGRNFRFSIHTKF